MSYYKDGEIISERLFWQTLESLAGPSQKAMLLEGRKVKIADSIYWIEG